MYDIVRRTLLFSPLVSLVILCSCACERTSFRRDMRCARLSEPNLVQVDGKADDVVWNHAAVLGARNGVTAKALWDEQRVYLLLSGHRRLLDAPEVAVCVKTLETLTVFSFEKEGASESYALVECAVSTLPFVDVIRCPDAAKWRSSRGLSYVDCRNSIEIAIPWEAAGLSSMRGQPIEITICLDADHISTLTFHLDLTEDSYELLKGDSQIAHVRRARAARQGGIIHHESKHAKVRRSGGDLYELYESETVLESGKGGLQAFEYVYVVTRNAEVSREDRCAGYRDNFGRLVTRRISGHTIDVEKVLDCPEDIITEERIRSWMESRDPQRATRFTGQMLAFDTLELRPVEVEIASNEERDEAAVVRVHTTFLTEARQSRSYFDSHLRLLKQVITIDGRDSYSLVRDEGGCKCDCSVVDISGTERVPSPRKINLFSRDALTYNLFFHEGSVIPDFPDAYSQTVDYIDDRCAVITVVNKIDMPHIKMLPREAIDVNAVRFLEHTKDIPCEDDEIIKLAQNIVGNTADIAVAVTKIKNFVHRHISNKSELFGDNSAFAVLETKTGTCKEHAILTCTLCRAAGIPCRNVVGYVYHDGAFVRHAWNQVYVNGDWLPIDSTANTWFGLLIYKYITLKVAPDIRSMTVSEYRFSIAEIYGSR